MLLFVVLMVKNYILIPTMGPFLFEAIKAMATMWMSWQLNLGH